jgi:hypothetical protein
MKNMDTWNFAHDYCGRLWWKMAWNMLIPSIVQCVFLIISIFPTEMALRKKFTDEGIRR